MKLEYHKHKIALTGLFVFLISLVVFASFMNNEVNAADSSAEFRLSYVRIKFPGMSWNMTFGNQTPLINFTVTNIIKHYYPGVEYYAQINKSSILVNFNGDTYTTSSVPSISCSNLDINGTNVTCAFVPLVTPDGAYILNVTASDNDGNPAQNETRLKIDTDPPEVTSVEPNGTAISINSDIKINFTDMLRYSSLPNSFTITDLETLETVKIGSIEYDNLTVIVDPYYFLDQNRTYKVEINTSIKNQAGISFASLFSWNFTTYAYNDTDWDNIPDSSESAGPQDKDNDGILNNVDMLNGDVSNIESGMRELIFEIDGSTNLAQQFSGMKKIIIYNSSRKLTEFNWNFSYELDLTNVLININERTNLGGIVIHGISLQAGQTKTVYINNLDRYSGVCIRNQEGTVSTKEAGGPICDYKNTPLDYIACNEISSDSNFRCVTEGDLYKITGLSHSAVEQANPYPYPEEPTVGGFGGGGGPSCPTSVECEPYGSCTKWGRPFVENEGRKFRTCNVIDCKGNLKRVYNESANCTYIPPEKKEGLQTFNIDGYPNLKIRTVTADLELGTAIVFVDPLYNIKLFLGDVQEIDLNEDGVFDLSLNLTSIIDSKHIGLSMKQIKAEAPDILEPESIFLIQEIKPVTKVVREISWLPVFMIVLILVLLTMLRLSDVARPNVRSRIVLFEDYYVKTKELLKQKKVKAAMRTYSNLRKSYEEILILEISAHKKKVYYQDLIGVYRDIFYQLADLIALKLSQEKISEASKDYNTLRWTYEDIIKKGFTKSQQKDMYTFVKKLYYRVEIHKLIKELEVKINKKKVSVGSKILIDINRNFKSLKELRVKKSILRNLDSEIYHVTHELNFTKSLVLMANNLKELNIVTAEQNYKSLLEEYNNLLDIKIDEKEREHLFNLVQRSFKSLLGSLLVQLNEDIKKGYIIESNRHYDKIEALFLSLGKSYLSDRDKKIFENDLHEAHNTLFYSVLRKLEKDVKKGFRVFEAIAAYPVLQNMFKDIIKELSDKEKTKLVKRMRNAYLCLYEGLSKRAIKEASSGSFKEAEKYYRKLGSMYDEIKHSKTYKNSLETIFETYINTYKKIFEIFIRQKYQEIKKDRVSDFIELHNTFDSLYGEVGKSELSKEYKQKYHAMIKSIYYALFEGVIKQINILIVHSKMSEAKDMFKELKSIYKRYLRKFGKNDYTDKIAHKLEEIRKYI